ncbi:MAG TPA: glycosyltransferase family 2 protein [Methanocorpusculum sp.]|nr:glycosyltransferase family 2 protein [Methanocorpusculum sp.]
MPHNTMTSETPEPCSSAASQILSDCAFPEPKKGIVVLIPAYNESLVIGSVVLQAKQYADAVVVVDDGSKDNTSEIARLAGAIVITMEKNEGKAHAMDVGFSYLQEHRPKVTVMMDGDGQHMASDIPALAAPVLAGEADLVVGSRFMEEGGEEDIPAYRKMGQRVLNSATNMSSSYKCSDSQSGFRALSREALRHVNFASSGYGFESDMLAHFSDLGLKMCDVPITVRYDVPNMHKMNPIKHGLSVLSGIFQLFTFKHPLVCFGVPGVFIAAIGVVLAVQAFEIVGKTGIWAPTVTIVAIMMVMMGLLLISVAIILYSISRVIKRG